MSDTQAGAVMAKPAGLRQRGKSWEMRVRVPRRVRSLLPTEIVRSLGAIAYKDACRRGWEVRAEIERQFEEAEVRLGLAERRVLPPIAAKFSEAELVDAARRYLSEREGYAPSIPLAREAQKEMRDVAEEDVFHLSHPETLDDPSIHALAEGFAVRQGYSLPVGEARYPYLEAIQEALTEHHNRLIARLDGATVATINPAFAGVEPGGAGEGYITLVDAMDMYIAAPERSANSSSSRKMDRSRLGALRDIVGPAKHVGSVTKADLRNYVDQLIKLPTNYTKRFPGMTPAEAIEAGQRAGASTLSAASIEPACRRQNRCLGGWNVRTSLPKAPRSTSRRPGRQANLLDDRLNRQRCARCSTLQLGMALVRRIGLTGVCGLRCCRGCGSQNPSALR